MRIAGIDADTKSIAIVIFDDAVYKRSYRLSIKGRRASDRIEGLFRLLQDTYVDLPCDWAMVERPVVGANRAAVIDQSMVVGMIRYWLWHQGQVHSLVDNGTWKKAVLGSGHASKEEIADYAKCVLEMPEGLSQDEYDAGCIAAFGARHKGKA